jgi:hypothetical protein
MSADVEKFLDEQYKICLYLNDTVALRLISLCRRYREALTIYASTDRISCANPIKIEKESDIFGAYNIVIDVSTKTAREALQFDGLPDSSNQEPKVNHELTNDGEVKLKNPIYRWPDDEP